MKKIKVGNKEYQLEYTFESAENRDVVQKMFNMLSGAYIIKHTNGSDVENDENIVNAMIDGTSEMVSEIPHVCIVAFYAGLLEHNPVSEEEAKDIMKAYMKENKISYRKLFEEIKTCMEDDGFFDLSGLKEMLEEMNGEQKTTKKAPKTPQDHMKPTSTK